MFTNTPLKKLVSRTRMQVSANPITLINLKVFHNHHHYNLVSRQTFSYQRHSKIAWHCVNLSNECMLNFSKCICNLVTGQFQIMMILEILGHILFKCVMIIIWLVNIKKQFINTKFMIKDIIIRKIIVQILKIIFYDKGLNQNY